MFPPSITETSLRAPVEMNKKMPVIIYGGSSIIAENIPPVFGTEYAISNFE
jgi:hypothetical protein